MPVNDSLIVFLQHSCDVNILLKRYLSSQAFVNVTRGLAQYFRRKTSQHPITLDKSSIVRHISEWMLEEVLAIASMTEQSVENVFRHTMRFNKRWGRILNPEDLPEDLKELQVSWGLLLVRMLLSFAISETRRYENKLAS